MIIIKVVKKWCVRSRAKRLLKSSFRLIFFHYGRLIFSIHHHFIHTFIWVFFLAITIAGILEDILNVCCRNFWCCSLANTHTHIRTHTNPSSEACFAYAFIIPNKFHLSLTHSLSHSHYLTHAIHLMTQILWTKNLLIKNFFYVFCRVAGLIRFVSLSSASLLSSDILPLQLLFMYVLCLFFVVLLVDGDGTFFYFFPSKNKYLSLA